MISERRLFLFEAEDDNNTSSGDTASDTTNDTAENNDTSADNNENEDQNNQEDNQNDENQDDNNQDDDEQNKEDNNDKNDEDEDQNNDDEFSINDDQDNDNQNNEDENQGNDNSEEENQPKSDSLKAKDREVFNSLSLAEQQIKIRELKQNFADLYGECNTLIDRFNEISIEFNDNYCNKISSCLIDLKGMISFYILNIYDLKSYFENDIMFNRYLTIFNAVKNTIGIINNNLSDDDNK